MLHARKDYNRIQDPAVLQPELLSQGSTPIGVDEPVFIIRAKDLSGPEAVRKWAEINLRNGGDPAVSGLVFSHARKMEEWQAKHGCKVADVPESQFEG